MIGHPDPPRSPHQMSDEELRAGGLDSMKHQELRHRELRDRIDSLLSGQSDLKRSLAKIHRADIAILFVGIVAAVAGVLLLALDFLRAFGGGK